MTTAIAAETGIPQRHAVVSGPRWLEARQIPARLVTSSGDVVRTQRWPSVKEHAHV